MKKKTQWQAEPPTLFTFPAPYTESYAFSQSSSQLETHIVSMYCQSLLLHVSAFHPGSTQLSPLAAYPAGHPHTLALLTRPPPSQRRGFVALHAPLAVPSVHVGTMQLSPLAT